MIPKSNFTQALHLARSALAYTFFHCEIFLFYPLTFDSRSANQKGAWVLPFQRQAECRPLCLPAQGADFRTAGLYVFSPLIYCPTRSTLRDNRVQRERWGNYTIFILRTAKKGLSAPVSAANTCHSYYCKEKKALVLL